MKSDDNLFNLIFWTGDGIKQRDKDDNLYIEYWVIPDIVKKTYGYQLQDLLWSDIVRVLGSDHKCVQSMTKKELIVNGRVIVIGQYLSDSIVNIVILNHHGFTFEDIATVILQLI